MIIKELEPEQREAKTNHLQIPPCIMTLMLLIVCNHGNSQKQQEVLHELHDLLHGDDGRYVRNQLRDISWQILGICQQICGDHQGALLSYQKSLRQEPFHEIQEATKTRIQDARRQEPHPEKCGTDHCASSPCKHEGTCTSGSTTFSCQCAHGFIGPTCEDTDHCASSPCKYNGTCTSGLTTFSCQCSDGFIGDKCENTDHCASSPCKYNGTCTSGPTTFSCQCEDGFIGETCEGSPPAECLTDSDPKGQLYTGTQNVTIPGDVCLRWDSPLPDVHLFPNLLDQANYCRNPDNESGPWCFILNPEATWALCDIPSC
ncbi:tissue-type plasminogen activator-like [Ostrea edulis]|uniref:tissue-type plasminogen activator-like n=1 Tax=Ostrea edulis TaxID=37623 RepID=UPI0024AEEA26|nr:tissue-type plasminogen activator-like [Ostrea edulis]